MLEELESLSPAQKAKRLAQIQGRITDGEQDEDDLDDNERDLLTDEFSTAVEVDQIRADCCPPGIARTGPWRSGGGRKLTMNGQS